MKKRNYIIYALIVIIIGLLYLCYEQYKEIKDYELVLEQCENAYYKLLDKK